MNKKVIFSILAIIIILGAVYFSQSKNNGGFMQNLVSGATDQAAAYLSKGAEWATSKIYSKIDSQVQERGESIQTGIDATKEKISETTDGVKNYFSGIAESVVNPNANTENSCQCQCPTTPN